MEEKILKDLTKELKTPEELVNFYYDKSYPSGVKRSLTKYFLEKNEKYTIEDIRKARNQHPVVKKSKNKNIQERTKRRLIIADKTAINKGKRLSKEELEFFLKEEPKTSTLQLAINLKRPLPTVFYLKRILRESGYSEETFFHHFL